MLVGELAIVYGGSMLQMLTFPRAANPKSFAIWRHLLPPKFEESDEEIEDWTPQLMASSPVQSR
jgi:hypothetical protein